MIRQRGSAAAGLAAAGVAAVLALTGCSAGPPAPHSSQDLGQVPIPTPPATQIQPTASPGRAQLVAIGSTVHIVDGARRGTATALGPDLALAGGGARRTSSPGTIAVEVRPQRGAPQAAQPPTLCAADLTVRDDLGHVVPVHANHPCGGSLVLSGTFSNGHATLTWNRSGKPLVTWDFEVELD